MDRAPLDEHWGSGTVEARAVKEREGVVRSKDTDSSSPRSSLLPGFELSLGELRIYIILPFYGCRCHTPSLAALGNDQGSHRPLAKEYKKGSQWG